MTKREPVPTWRKILAIVFFVLVVGPLLFSMFYSFFTHTSFGDIFVKVGFYWPYLGIFVVIAFIVGISDLVRRWGRSKEKPRGEQERESPGERTGPS